MSASAGSLDPWLQVAARAAVPPFHVMDLLAAANRRAETHGDVVNMVAGQPSKQDLDRLLQGVWLSDGKVRARRVRRLKPQGDSTWLRIVLSEGKNREIRRMLAKLGHKVMRLKRVAIGPVELDRLPKGKARRLNVQELTSLRGAVESGQKRLAKVRERAAGKAKTAEA